MTNILSYIGIITLLTFVCYVGARIAFDDTAEIDQVQAQDNNCPGKPWTTEEAALAAQAWSRARGLSSDRRWQEACGVVSIYRGRKK